MSLENLVGNDSDSREQVDTKMEQTERIQACKSHAFIDNFHIPLSKTINNTFRTKPKSII